MAASSVRGIDGGAGVWAPAGHTLPAPHNPKSMIARRIAFNYKTETDYELRYNDATRQTASCPRVVSPRDSSELLEGAHPPSRGSRAGRRPVDARRAAPP